MQTTSKLGKTGSLGPLSTRKLISAFACASVLLVWTVAPVLASFAGTFRNNGDPLSVEVTPYGGNAGNTVVTVTYLSKRGQTVEFGTVPPGADLFVLDHQLIPKGTKLIVVEIDSPVGGYGYGRVSHGLDEHDLIFYSGCLQASFNCDGSRFVFEVVD